MSKGYAQLTRFIGQIARGFDFLGYHFSAKPLQLAAITVNKHLERLHRLYEQQHDQKTNMEEVVLVLGVYVKRWWSWCHAGVELDSFSCGMCQPLINQT